MHRKSTIGVLLVLVCAGLFVSALHGQPRPMPARPPQPPQPGQVQQQEGREPVENQRTRVQVEIFQLDGTSAELARLDLDKVAAGSISEVLVRMAEAGKAKLMHRVDAPAEFGRSMTVTSGNRVPIVRDVAAPGGATTRSVNYEQTGLQLSLSGLWTKDQDDGTWAHLNCDLQWSSVGETDLQAAAGDKNACFGQFNFNQPLQLRSGEPVMFLASHQPLVGDKEGRGTLGLVRLTVTHLEK